MGTKFNITSQKYIIGGKVMWYATQPPGMTNTYPSIYYKAHSYTHYSKIPVLVEFLYCICIIGMFPAVAHCLQV